LCCVALNDGVTVGIISPMDFRRALPPPGIPGRIMVSAFRSPALAVAAAFAIGGAGFTVANLLLARSLPPIEFGLVSLILGLLNLGLQVAPLGADGAINRARIRPTPWLLGRAFLASLAVASVIALISRIVYGLAIDLVALILVGVVAGGLTQVAAATYQSRQSFAISICLTHIANLVLFAAGVLVLAAHLADAIVPVAFFVGGYVCTAIVGWRALFRSEPAIEEDATRFGWIEPLSYAGVNAAGLVLLMLERLMVPKLLSLEDLATFGVLAAVVIAPFHVLQLGIGYTLLPRLCAATGVAERRQLVYDEALLMGVVVLAGAIIVYFLAPPVVDIVLAGKYELTRDLLLAGLLSSILRTASGFTKGAVTALCSNRELAVLNVLMWVTVGIAVAGALMGAQWGLVGLIYGTSVGWAIRTLVSALIAGRHLVR
jgi:O-antigen/teichoic acid export membrane protein